MNGTHADCVEIWIFSKKLAVAPHDEKSVLIVGHSYDEVQDPTAAMKCKTPTAMNEVQGGKPVGCGLCSKVRD
jgi:hypothetical protein